MISHNGHFGTHDGHGVLLSLDTGTPSPQLADLLEQLNADTIAISFQELAPLAGNPVLWSLMQERWQALQRHAPTLDPAAEDYPYSDAFNALRLVQGHRHEMRYCTPWKSWLVWTGTHWQRDTIGLVLRWQRQTVMALGAQLPQSSPKHPGSSALLVMRPALAY